MREIKFNFVYGIDGETETYFTKSFTFAEIEGGDHFDEISDSPLLRDYSILAKRQYTGLKDKNGKEICEGDIVKWGENIETVFYSVDNAAFETETSMLDNESFEVIGNIYENKELLGDI